MFNQNDINLIQKNRPDLSEDQCGEVLGFILDMWNIEPFEIKNNERFFKETADYAFPLEAA